MQKPLWDSLWVNVHLATMTPAHGYLFDGALAIKDGRIAWVGHISHLPAGYKALATITYDGHGCWMTPGFIDCHTHLVYAGQRADDFAERLAGASYGNIARAGGGILSTVQATREASAEILYTLSAKRLRCFLQEGVTTIEIKSGYGLDVDNEIKILSVAHQLADKFPITVKTTLLAAHVVPPEFAGRADDYISYICEKTIPTVAKLQLADAVDGFCDHMAFSPAQLSKVFTTAAHYGLEVKVHAEQFSDSQGTQLAARFNALSAAYLEYATEAGIAALAQSDTSAVLLPGAYYYLQSTQKPPIDLLRRYYVPFAIASDFNPSTSPMASLLSAMNMACLLFGATVDEALAGVTINAARALNISMDVGSLAVGKVADIALWDIESPLQLVQELGTHRLFKVIKAGQARHRDSF